jgi:hypothetical protein
LSQSERRQPTPTMTVGIINSGETIIRAIGAITRDGTAIVGGDGIITDDMTGIHYRRDVRHDNRGHHKGEIRQDFKDIGNARNEVIQGRRELRADYQELRRDRAELRRDIRNGASKEEIFRDRQEIRADWDEIRKDRTELRRDQAQLDAARRELKADLRKR